MHEVVPGLFIGPIEAAYHWERLREKNIKHVLNLSNTKYAKASDIRYMSIGVEDSSDVDISRHFQDTQQFIDKGLFSEFWIPRIEEQWSFGALSSRNISISDDNRRMVDANQEDQSSRSPSHREIGETDRETQPRLSTSTQSV